MMGPENVPECQVCSSNPDCVGGDCGQRNKQRDGDLLFYSKDNKNNEMTK